MKDHQNFKEPLNPTIKDIYSIKQLLSSYLVADAIIEIRNERKTTLNDIATKNIPKLEVNDDILQHLYATFAKLVGYRYPFVYMAKIGFEDMIKYEFIKDPSVVNNAGSDTAHLSTNFGGNYTLLSKINLFEHTLNVFNQALDKGEQQGRVIQIAIPMLASLFHDFGKSTKIRSQLVGNNVGKVYKAHAEVSSMYIKEILAPKYYNLVKEQPQETLDMLSNTVANHHPSGGKHKSDTNIAFVIEADNKARKEEFKRLQIEFKKD